MIPFLKPVNFSNANFMKYLYGFLFYSMCLGIIFPFYAKGSPNSPAGNVFGGPFNNRPPYNNTDSAYRTYTFNSDGRQSPFYRVQQTDYPTPNGSTGNGSPIQTYPCNANVTNYSCAVGEYNKTDGGIVFAADALQTEHDVANGNTDAFAEAGFEQGNLWLSRKNLFDRLDADYNLRSADAALEAFYNTNTTSVYGKLKALDELKSNFLLMAEKDSLVAGAMLADLKNKNNLLSKAVQQEANHQLFNEIYLSTLNTSFKGFTAKQQDALFALANSCPYIDGDAVYRARTLYAQIDNTIFFDNEALCATAKVAYKKENTEQQKESKPFFAKFAPNPARGFTSLIYQIDKNTTATLLLTNQLGQEALAMPLVGNTNKVDVPVANLMTGIYFYKITNHLGETLSGKLNIFK